MERLRAGDPVQVGVYRIVGRLTSSGMRNVFLGLSPSGRKVVVKLINPAHARAPHFRERFAREIAAARQVRGFHTAPVVDANPDADPPWLATAFIEGPSLEDAVSSYGPLSAPEVRTVAAGLTEGLSAIHA